MNKLTLMGITLLAGGILAGCRVETDVDDDVPHTTVVNTQPPVVVEDKTPDVTVEHKTPPVIIEKGPDVEIKQGETSRSTTGF